MRSVPREHGLSPEKTSFTTPKTKSACGSDTIAHPRNTTTPARSPGMSCGFSPRATQWVYLSTVRGYELKEVALLREAEAKGDLFVLTSAKSETVTAPPPAEEPVAEDSFL